MSSRCAGDHCYSIGQSSVHSVIWERNDFQIFSISSLPPFFSFIPHLWLWPRLSCQLCAHEHEQAFFFSSLLSFLKPFSLSISHTLCSLACSPLMSPFLPFVSHLLPRLNLPPSTVPPQLLSFLSSPHQLLHPSTPHHPFASSLLCSPTFPLPSPRRSSGCTKQGLGVIEVLTWEFFRRGLLSSAGPQRDLSLPGLFVSSVGPGLGKTPHGNGLSSCLCALSQKPQCSFLIDVCLGPIELLFLPAGLFILFYLILMLYISLVSLINWSNLFYVTHFNSKYLKQNIR